MRWLGIFFLFVFILSCEQDKPRSYDYIQYRALDLGAYDLSARIMLPNASAGIGTSMRADKS